MLVLSGSLSFRLRHCFIITKHDFSMSLHLFYPTTRKHTKTQSALVCLCYASLRVSEIVHNQSSVVSTKHKHSDTSNQIALVRLSSAHISLIETVKFSAKKQSPPGYMCMSLLCYQRLVHQGKSDTCIYLMCE